MYRLKAESFCLTLRPEVHPEDLRFPVNTSLSVEVYSRGFSARAVLDLDVRALADFAVRLERLYKTLAGSARLQEPYGAQSCIEFAAKTGGHIAVRGKVCGGAVGGQQQQLLFQNEFDQTCLREFAGALAADFGRYAR